MSYRPDAQTNARCRGSCVNSLASSYSSTTHSANRNLTMPCSPGDHDSLERYDAVYAAFDAIMPWAVGRYPNEDDFQNLPQDDFSQQLRKAAEETEAASAGYTDDEPF